MYRRGTELVVCQWLYEDGAAPGISVNLGVAKWLFDIYTSVDIKS
jgi:hypothetical protein